MATPYSIAETGLSTSSDHLKHPQEGGEGGKKASTKFRPRNIPSKDRLGLKGFRARARVRTSGLRFRVSRFMFRVKVGVLGLGFRVRVYGYEIRARVLRLVRVSLLLVRCLET